MSHADKPIRGTDGSFANPCGPLVCVSVMTTRHFRFDGKFATTSLEIVLSGDIPSGQTSRVSGSPSDNVGIPVRLKSTVLRYEWDDAELSMAFDYAALLAMLSFYPVICGSSDAKSVVTFGWPVSDLARDAVEEWEPTIEVRSDAVGDPPEHDRRPVISFGGGVDSTALSMMFPDADLAHEVPLEVRSGGMQSAVYERLSDSGNATFIYTNQRQLYDVWGLGSWPALFAAALLTNPGVILSGVTIMENSLLLAYAGVRQRLKHLRWYRLMSRIGPRMTTMEFMPSSCSARIVALEGLISQTAYCHLIRHDDCGTCYKCLRRRTMFALADQGSSPRPLAGFAPSMSVLDDLDAGERHGRIAFVLGIERSLLPGWISTRVYPNHGHLLGRVGFQERYLASAITASGYTSSEKFDIERKLASWGIAPMTVLDRRNIAGITPASAEVVMSGGFVRLGS